MRSCQTYQEQMLEYLYALLEEGERQLFEQHLSGCASCQSALRQARAQQNLLASAVRLAFPHVQFQPPREDPAVLPLPVGGPASRRWRVGKRWALAAGLLLAVFLALPASWMIGDYTSARRSMAQGEETLAQLRRAMNDTAEQIRQAPRDRDAHLEKLKSDIRERQVEVQLTGPLTLPLGQSSEFQLQTRSSSGKPLNANLSVQAVMGPEREQLAVQCVAPGDYCVTVPAKLAVRPQSAVELLVSASRPDGFSAQLHDLVPVTAPEYVTHLATDKPLYQPGETVYFRSLTLERSSHRPAREELQLIYGYTTPTGSKQLILQAGNRLRLNDPSSGPEFRGPDGEPVRGVGAGAFLLSDESPGGEYILEVREGSNRFPPQQRKFLVNSYQKPRLNKELDFNCKSYGAGEEVQALCKASRADGGPVKEKPVEVTVQVDDRTYDARGQASNQPIHDRTDAEGKVIVRFRLPQQIEKGQASLAVKFQDGGNTDTLVRTIPIVVKSMQVEFFPEGGDLVADLVNRVYFQARTPLGKPADIKGHLLEDGQPLPVKVETLNDDKEPGINQGMGRFEFTPKAGKTYQLRIDSPRGIDKSITLPRAEEDGVVLRIDEGMLTEKQPLKVRVQTSKRRQWAVGVTCRGQLLGSADLASPGSKPGEKDPIDSEIKLKAGAGGVCRVTLYEKLTEAPGRTQMVPRAERLIYRRQAEQLHLVVKPDRGAYVPGQKVTLGFESLNEQEQPTSAVMMVGVVDKSVLTLADDKTARTMPTHFLLTSAIKKSEDLEYADFLLGPHPKAAEALDLLLGVHGWRHFTPANYSRLMNTPRLVGATEMIPGLRVSTSGTGQDSAQVEWTESRRLRQEHHEKLQALSKRYSQAETDASEVRESSTFVAASARVQKYQRFFEDARAIALPVLAAVGVLILLAGLAITLGQSLRQALPCYVVGGVCVALLVVVAGLPQPSKEPGVPQEVAQVAMTDPAWEQREKDPIEAKDSSAPMPTATASPVASGRGLGSFDKEDKFGAAREPQGLGRPASQPAMPAPAAAIPMGGPLPLTRLEGKQLQEGLGAIPPGQAGGAEAKNAMNHQFYRMMIPQGQQGLANGRGLERDNAKQAINELRDMKANADRAAGLAKAGIQMPQDQRRKQELAPLLEIRAGGAKGPAVANGSAMVVREYAHQRAGGLPEVRSDFAETLFWHPVLVLPGGKTQVSFDLCDSVTSFQVTAFGHSLDGRLGAANYVFDSRLPFTVQPKVPQEVTASDRIDIPLSISNNTDQKRTVEVTLGNSQGLELKQETRSTDVTLNPESSVRQLFRFQPNIKEGTAALSFKGQTKGFAPDTIRMGFRVVPEGFPIVAQQSDLLEKSALAQITLPSSWVKGTLKLQAHVYPSTLADLQKGLEGLLREPHGCFEQTSTCNYPNLLILDYLRQSDQSMPNVEARARDLLGRGYQRLVSFECQNSAKNQREGYEWFGGTAAPHEALTAYGLLQFRDLARVQEVDRDMLERTRHYLLSRRDGKGGFSRNPRALDSFGRAPEQITNAYIVWALSESGEQDDLSVELKVLTEQASRSVDPYLLSLVANTLINRAKTEEGVTLLRKIAGLQKEEGYLQAESTSITGSGGRDLQIETTALAVLGWLKANNGEFHRPIDRAIHWIGKQRGGHGGFGSTQATILALKALINFARINKRTAEAGELSLLIDEQKVTGLKFPTGVTEPLTLHLDDAENHLKSGSNKVRLDITGKNVFPYTLTWTYQTLQPVSAENCTVKLATRLAKTGLNEGDLVRLNVSVENTSDKGQGMATAIVGIPAGLSLPEDLKQMRDYSRTPEDGSRPQLGAFEIRGRELVLYWRDLAPKEKIELPVDLIARVPGVYSGPASRAYLYYNADSKHWIEPLTAVIKAKE